MDEVSCCICDMPLEKAATLQCSHSFCLACIEGWIDRAKRLEQVNPWTSIIPLIDFVKV